MRLTVTSAEFSPLLKLPWVASALRATIPSGYLRLVALRQRLTEAIVGHAAVQVDGAVPTVIHVQSLPAGLCGKSVFVGAPINEQHTSPYTCPFQGSAYCVSSARQYLHARADLDFFSRLLGRVLYCDCALPKHECWAFILAEFAAEVSCHSDSPISDGSEVDAFINNARSVGGLPASSSRHGDPPSPAFGERSWVGAGAAGRDDMSCSSCASESGSSESGSLEGLPCEELLPLNRVLRNEGVEAAGLQTSHHRFPQLIEDGLSPAEHSRRALELDHQVATAIPSTPTVQNALAWGVRCPNLPRARSVVCKILEEIAEATAEEDDEILNRVHPHVFSTHTLVRKLRSCGKLHASQNRMTTKPPCGWHSGYRC